MLLWLELRKLYRRWTTYLPYMGFLVLAGLVVLGMRLEQDAFVSGGFGGDMVVSGKMITAQTVAWFLMVMSFAVFVPLFAALAGAPLVASEVTGGTLRTIATRPVSRLELLLAKYVAAFIYAGSVCMFLGIAGFIIGLAVFGSGDLVSGDPHQGGVYIYNKGESYSRLALAYGLGTYAALSVTALAFLFSTLIGQSLAATIATVALLLVCAITSQLQPFKPAAPYFFTSHLMIGPKAFLDPVPWNEVAFTLKVVSVYLVACFAVAAAWFSRRDILC